MMRIPALLTVMTMIGLLLVAGADSSTSLTDTVSQSATRFSSAYTGLTKCGSGLTKKEEREAERHGTDIPTLCKGLDGYRINVSYSACASMFDVEKDGATISLGMQALNYPQKTVEWRLANGKPFAVIMRVYEYAGTEGCPMDGKITSTSLIVKGLKGYEHIDEEVDVKATPNPNVKARELADKGYAQPKS